MVVVGECAGVVGVGVGVGVVVAEARPRKTAAPMQLANFMMTMDDGCGEVNVG